ncbi:MAG: hypothetical protein WCL11_25465 [Verrucomicrobiota bacterium]
MKKHLPQLAGKVLSVLCTGEDTGQLIYDPFFQDQGGRLFMVGIVPKEASRDNWMEGLLCAIAWDTVQDYVIFASMDDYLTRLKAPAKRWPSPNKTVQRTGASRSARKKKRTSSAAGSRR